MRRGPAARRVEKKFGLKLEDLLPAAVQEYGVTGAAAGLGVAQSTLSYWITQLGLKSQTSRKTVLVPAVRVRPRLVVMEVVLGDGQ